VDLPTKGSKAAGRPAYTGNDSARGGTRGPVLASTRGGAAGGGAADYRPDWDDAQAAPPVHPGFRCSAGQQLVHTERIAQPITKGRTMSDATGAGLEAFFQAWQRKKGSRGWGDGLVPVG